MRNFDFHLKEDVESMVSRNAFILDRWKDDAKEKGKLEVVKNLLDILNDETIALKTGIDIEKIKELRRLNK